MPAEPGKPTNAPTVATGEAIEEVKQAAEESSRAKENALEGRTRGEKLERFRSQLESEAIASPDSESGTFLFGAGVNRAPGPSVPKAPATAAWGQDRALAADDAMLPLGDLQEGGGLGAPQAATGFASLDVEFPTRGQEYRFTTPGGDTQISASAIERPLLNRLLRLLGVVVGLAVLAALYRQLKRFRFDDIVNRATCVLLVIFGFLLLLFLPWVGLLLLLLGLLQLIRLTWMRRQAVVAA
jgi:hypothetical protein